MIDEVIQIINDSLSGIRSDEVLFGLTQRIYRTIGDEDAIEYFPGFVKHDGEVVLVDIDDINSILLYHKTNAASLTNPVRGGYGDTLISEDVISFSLTAIWDTRKLKIHGVDLLLLLKSRIPQGIAGVAGIDNIQIIPVSASLLSKQIFDSDFSIGSKYLLPEFINLIQINYNIRLKYDQNCIEKCVNCSN